MANTDTPNGIGLPEAADQFERILGGDKPTTSTPRTQAVMKAAEVDEEPTDAAQQKPATTDAEETPELTDVEALAILEAGKEEAGVAPEEGTEEQGEQPKFVTVKVDGKDEQVPFDEVLKGYSRTADYTRKTQELAAERKQAAAEANAVREERAQYGQMLSALQTQLTQMLPKEPDWQQLYDADPLEYMRQRDVWRERNEKMAAAHSEQQRLHSLSAEEQRAQIQKMVKEGREKLVSTRPEWKNPDKWEADRTKILKYGTTAGYSEEELSQATDPRAILILDKARRFDELMAKRPPAPSVPAKSPPAARAGSAASVPRSSSEATRARQRLAKSGRLNDAAAIFEKFID
jgi:hypothetical protein